VSQTCHSKPAYCVPTVCTRNTSVEVYFMYSI
jgi:hypothetical protein